ncbi:MAG: hypothetical protein KDJ25_09820 [Rhodoblastus sp.]|nr:hypothetical protein [Rhodoblastus sp.]
MLASGLASAAGVLSFPVVAADRPIALRLADRTGDTISPLVFGSNEIGMMDGGPPSASFDRRAGVAARRLGGDLTTTYNWVNNACNAGKNHNQANGDFLLKALDIPRSEWARPAIVVEKMHEASLAIGARSLVTLSLSPYVAADFDGAVAAIETAPSRRFTPTRWTVGAGARDPIDRSVCDLPQLVARLVAKYGEARSSHGVFAYALDNEPGLWTQNHPRVAPARMAIDEFIARSVAAARAIKTVDPTALVFGPSSWGATEMVNFQNAPDWPAHARYGSFLALYLDAFRKASEQDGKRLLDTLDVHWYPFTSHGKLFRTDTEALDAVRLDAPRSLTESGFREESWVARALNRAEDDRPGLPVLPSLQRIIARRFPGTKLSISEFNYGLGKRIPSALALANALGRYATSGVYLATHWGSLADLLNESYRLYREPDALGAGFSGRSVSVRHAADDALSAFAADDGSALRLVLINRASREIAVEFGALRRMYRHTHGFEADRPIFGERAETPQESEGALRFVLPAYSARRYLFV